MSSWEDFGKESMNENYNYDNDNYNKLEEQKYYQTITESLVALSTGYVVTTYLNN